MEGVSVAVPQYVGADNLEVMRLAVNYNRNLLSILRRTACSASRVLDFGAGLGMFARSLSGEGREVLCIEPDDYMCAELRSHGLSCVSSLAGVPRGSIEFAYTLAVLEHVEDDRRTVGMLAETLGTGGRLLIYVPAIPALYSAMDKQVGHLRRYTKKGLAKLAEDSGLIVESICFLDSLGVLASLLYKFTNGGGGINPLMLRIYDRVAFPISLLFDKLLRQVVGKNLIMVCRRP